MVGIQILEAGPPKDLGSDILKVIHPKDGRRLPSSMVTRGERQMWNLEIFANQEAKQNKTQNKTRNKTKHKTKQNTNKTM